MVEYNKENVKLSDIQINNLKSAIKNQTGAILRMNIKMYNEKHWIMENSWIIINNNTKN